MLSIAVILVEEGINSDPCAFGVLPSEDVWFAVSVDSFCTSSEVSISWEEVDESLASEIDAVSLETYRSSVCSNVAVFRLLAVSVIAAAVKD